MAALPCPATVGFDTFCPEIAEDREPLPSIEDVRAAYLRRAAPPRHLGQNVDITIGIDRARSGSDQTVDLLIVRPSHDSRAWTGNATSLRRRVFECVSALFGLHAPVVRE